MLRRKGRRERKERRREGRSQSRERHRESDYGRDTHRESGSGGDVENVGHSRSVTLPTASDSAPQEETPRLVPLSHRGPTRGYPFQPAEVKRPLTMESHMGETGGTIPGVRREAEKEVAAMEAIGQWGKDAATHYSSRGYKHSPRSITLPDAAERYPFDTSNGGIGHAVRDRDTILPPMGA
ncbi:unnamed protein product, partial [Symbiodinium sp. KB8]